MVPKKLGKVVPNTAKLVDVKMDDWAGTTPTITTEMRVDTTLAELVSCVASSGYEKVQDLIATTDVASIAIAV